MNDTFFVYEYTGGISVVGFLEVMPADGVDGGDLLSADQLMPAADDGLVLAAEADDEDEDEGIAPYEADFSSEAEQVFADMAEAVEADDGLVLTAFGEVGMGSDRGDLLIGDGGIDPGVMAELMASVGDFAG